MRVTEPLERDRSKRRGRDGKGEQGTEEGEREEMRM